MRPGKKVMAAILMWSAVSSGALGATDEPNLTPGPSAKASTEIPKEPAPPPSVTVIGAYDARGILGRDVKSTADEDEGFSEESEEALDDIRKDVRRAVDAIDEKVDPDLEGIRGATRPSPVAPRLQNQPVC